MFNLLVSSNETAWTGRRYFMPLDRIGESTNERLKARFKLLDEDAISYLESLPCLFAYERPVGLPARVGRVSRLVQSSSRSELRFDLSFHEELGSIASDALESVAWELDVGQWELNRTHWAVKDADLFEVLRDASLIPDSAVQYKRQQTSSQPFSLQSNTLTVRPKVFAAPARPQEHRLVSVMMPFEEEFRPVYDAIQLACKDVGLACERVDNIWESESIIQDVFDLIYSSKIVVVDLTGRNSNVLYETGIAHTLGRHVVPISQNIGDLPFDLAHQRALRYLRNEQGLTEMRAKLASRLKTLSSHDE